MSSLLNLGKYQFLSVLKDWMSLKDVCSLDDAFCGNSSRIIFLEMLSGHVGHNVGLIGPSDLILSDSFFSWLLLRNVSLALVQTTGSRIEKYVKSQISSSVNSILIKKCSNKNGKCLLEHISMCPKLDELIIEGLADNKTCFESSIDCPALIHVELRNINLSVDFLNSLGNCKYITNLSLMECKTVTDAEFCGLISKNTLLTVLNISGCVALTDTSLDCVASNCKLLVDFNVSDTTGCNFLNSNMEGLLTSCDQITSLDISSNYESVTYSTATLIAQHCNKRLLKLNISLNGKITHAGIEIVCSNCVNLTCLDMAGLCLSQLIMDVISAHLNKLRSIRIERSEMFPAHLSYVVLFSMFSEITTFCYGNGPIVGTPYESVEMRDDYSSYIDDRSQLLLAVLPKLKKLEEIELMYSYDKKVLITLFAECFTHLRVFKAGNLDDLIDKVVLQLAGASSKLVEVDFCLNESLTDGSLCKLFENNPNLTRVHLNYLRMITDISIVTLAKCCRYLEVLNVRLCTRLTDISIDALCAHSRCLSKIDTEHTKFSAEAMVRLKQCCVGLSVE